MQELTPDIFESYLEESSPGRRSGAVQMIKRVYNWANKRGNHSWVEIWDDGRWNFTGACEYSAKGLYVNSCFGKIDAAIAGLKSCQRGLTTAPVTLNAGEWRAVVNVDQDS